MVSPSVLERAFELARTGQCRSLTEILRRLKEEGFGDARQHLDGNHVRSQIRSLFPNPDPAGGRGSRENR